jgi:branched-chain amino acid transport system substrate-binding protein
MFQGNGRKQTMKRIVAMLAGLVASGALAQAPGITEDRILIGQTAGFTGVQAGAVTETAAGARLYLDAVNKAGGVNGRKIELLSMDDGFDPKRAAANAKVLIEEKKVFAIFLNRGTPHSEAILPLVNQHGVPLVAPSTGAQLLHDPVNRYVFNVRAKYQAEAEKGVVQLAAMGMSRIAVIHVDDSFGKDGLAGALKGFKGAQVEPLAVVSYERTTKDVSAQVKSTLAKSPQAVIVIGSGDTAAQLIKGLRAGSPGLSVLTMSNNSSASFVKSLGPDGHGVIVTQVFPNPKMATSAIAVEMMRMARNVPTAVVSHSAMEGFAAAKVLVEGLRRAGRKPTREGFIAALDGLHNFDVGGLTVDYSPKDHTGTDYVELSMVGKNGQFVQR